ncbi:MAG: alpha/beta hydrolase [Bacteroidetes bacterium]|nr:alpha/beta hydrolase [Bacteroidota bacterium]
MKLIQKLAIRYVKANLRMLSLVSKKKAAKKALKLFSTPMVKQKTKTPAVFDKGEKLSFKINGGSVRGYRWQPKQQAEKRILIIHGFESNIKKFDVYISAFLKKGYEVLAFDGPAHGDSEGKQITLPLYIEMIKNVYERFGPIDFFIAHSFGGLALSLFLEKIKDNKKKKLVLIAPASEMKTAIDNFFIFLELDNEVRHEFDKLILDRTGHQAGYFSISRAVKNIQSSILWVHDKTDDITPISDALKVEQENHPNISFIFTNGLGHRKIYRDKEVVKKIEEFLV